MSAIGEHILREKLNILEMARKNKDSATSRNLYTFWTTLNYLSDTICASYKFIELPEDLKDKNWYIKRNLELKGLVVLFREKETGHLLCLPATIHGTRDVYGEYSGYEVIGENGFREYVRKEECAVCWNTINRTDNVFDIFETAERIAEIQRTADVRLVHHKNPVVFVGDKKLSESYRLFWNQVENNEPSIVIDSTLKTAGGNASPINFDSPFINKELYQYKMQLLMEFFQKRGINFNPETGKKERMVVAEVDSNNEAIEISSNIYLEPRKEFCERAKELFPECSKMDVEWIGRSEKEGEENVIPETNKQDDSKGNTDRTSKEE